MRYTGFYIAISATLLSASTAFAQTVGPVTVITGRQVVVAPPTIPKTKSIRIICASSISPGNAPLFVVDGTPITEEQSKTINPDDIDKIEVLHQDKATVFYGSQAANGAILITLKK
jgi:predicted aconitase